MTNLGEYNFTRNASFHFSENQKMTADTRATAGEGEVSSVHFRSARVM